MGESGKGNIAKFVLFGHRRLVHYIRTWEQKDSSTSSTVNLIKFKEKKML